MEEENHSILTRLFDGSNFPPPCSKDDKVQAKSMTNIHFIEKLLEI